MASWFVCIPGSSGLCLSPGYGYCVVFLDKTLNNSHSACLHPGV